MKTQAHSIILLFLLVAVLATSSCGGGSVDSLSSECTPSPQITSTPPTLATAGVQYYYHVDASWLCIPLVCNSVNGVRLPPGATIDDFHDYVIWTPPNNSAGSVVNFSIATEPDTCGDSVTQSWQVSVFAPPVIYSFSASVAAVDAGETTNLIPDFSGSGTILGIGQVTSGVPVTTPPLYDDTSYTLVVTNQLGIKTQSVLTILVPEPPVITYFSPVRSPIEVGTTGTLRWSASGDWSVARIEPGDIDVLGSSSVNVSPTTDTTYTLTLNNALGETASRDTLIQLVPPPSIQDFTASPTSTSYEGTVTLTATFQDGNGIIWEDEGDGQYSYVASVISGQSVNTEPLKRSTLYRLEVKSLASTTITQDILVQLTGTQTFKIITGDPIIPLRSGHTATLLNDSRVLIVGGYGLLNSSPTEIFDPVSETFSPGPVLLHNFQYHDATLMADGRVFIVGTYYDNDVDDSVLKAEIYDPGSGLLVEALNDSRIGGSFEVIPKTINLNDGRVLVTSYRHARIYQPLTDSITDIPFSDEWITSSTTNLRKLNDGRVLIINNHTGSYLFDPVTDTLKSTAFLSNHLGNFASTVLGNGKVLIAGGEVPGKPAKIYDPAIEGYVSIGAQLFYSDTLQAATLNNGNALLTGGSSGSGRSVWSEIFNITDNSFTATSGLLHSRDGHSATLLQDGHVLVVGGCSDLPCPAELYVP